MMSLKKASLKIICNVVWCNLLLSVVIVFKYFNRNASLLINILKPLSVKLKVMLCDQHVET